MGIKLSTGIYCGETTRRRGRKQALSTCGIRPKTDKRIQSRDWGNNIDRRELNSINAIENLAEGGRRR